jgi:hypothetical protein
MTLLFPIAIFTRKVISPVFYKENKFSELEIFKKNFLNNFLYKIISIDAFFIKNKKPLPFGLSIIGVFKK